jgi:prepilin-type N-terminal cleavage/methylation domain-containing protein
MIHRFRLPSLPQREQPSDSPKIPLRAQDSRAGFSLIELLTVIAIIAILAAIIFPIAGSVRRSAQEAQVISNLQAIQTSLGIYKQDEHGYPPTLGPIIFNSGGVSTQFNGMYPEFLKDKGAFFSPANEADRNTQYSVDLLSSLNYVAGRSGMPAGINDPVLNNNGGMFYGWDNMDGHVKLDPNDPTRGTYILHYSRYRTWNRNDPDYKRQLGFRNPPEDTVVTWNDSFVNRPNGVDQSGEYLVLFLNGTVKKFTVAQVKAVDGAVWRLKPY